MVEVNGKVFHTVIISLLRAPFHAREYKKQKAEGFFGGFERPSKATAALLVLGWGSGRPKARESAQRPFSAFMQIPPGKEKGRGGQRASPPPPISPSLSPQECLISFLTPKEGKKRRRRGNNVVVLCSLRLILF